ncbi:MAG: homoserine O-succinyltransferase [Steroidobacteraceae bacterium]|jgi:homoserine O-acetyltransferase|nr:homoserine O-succinyltransferase [Steroidobacteraceae bacterium]
MTSLADACAKSAAGVASQPVPESEPCGDEASSPASCPVREGVLESSEPLALHFGGRLDGLRVAWRLYGPADAPVVAALGGISAGRHVADVAGESGWWSEIVSEGGALDTRRWRILGIDFVGGSHQSTGPERGQSNFPSISAYDQVEALRRVMAHLGIKSLAGIVGASYGGMVALAFAERWPALVQNIVVISAAHRAHPMSTAWRSVQRAMVRYALARGDGPEGLRLARALAMATYRSAQEFDARFDAPPVRVDGRFQFPVESYLLARGDAYASTYKPEAFVCLSESIDLHRVEPTRIRTATTLVAVREDQLAPIEDMRALHASLAGPAELVEMSSLYGHDAFLKESAILRDVFARALQPSDGES